MKGYTEKAKKGYLETGTLFPRDIIWSMGLIKAAAAKANHTLGIIGEEQFRAIYETALELARGEYDDEITVDVYQTGSGTGLNLNVNEVIAKHASSKYGVRIHPLDDVNKSQSSNDVIPTAVRLMALKKTKQLIQSIEKLYSQLEELAEKYRDYVKPGRTHLRDALPITFGLELDAYAKIFKHHTASLSNVMKLLLPVPLGGTAVGTGANSPKGYREKAVSILAELSGFDLKSMENPSAKMKSVYDLIILSGAFRALGLDLYRLCQDLRLLYSGPFTGIGEIDIKMDVPGSSIMPGKRNPVTLEAIMQAIAEVFGLDSSIGFSATLGELELYLGYPLIAYNLHTMASLLIESINKLVDVVLPNLKPDKEKMESLAWRSAALLTALSPLLGYDKVARIVEKISSGMSIHEALRSEGLPEKLLEKVDPRRMLQPYDSRED